jgi:methyltransferase (TIGR00027 family)
MVAAIRAVADRGLTGAPGFRDPYARALLPLRWRLFARMAERGLSRVPVEKRAEAFARLDVVPLRVLAIDAELELAAAAGVRQVVILGAGLDTRAHRLSTLHESHVFEVDHPATQKLKRRRAQGLPLAVEAVSYVPVDFERDALPDRLAAAGHRRDLPTAWVWEGVVMYLSDPALRGTLQSMAALSAPGSVALVHYHEPDPPSRERRGMRALLSLWGEPQIGQRSRETIAAELASNGWKLLRDSGTDDWASRFGALSAQADLRKVSRLAVAEPARG